MKKNSFIVFASVLVLLIIATFFRVYNLNVTPSGLYPDEAINGNNALEVVHGEPMRVFYPENNGREGLFINIQSFFISWFGNFPWALRLVSALFGIITVLGVYGVVWALIRKKSYAYLLAFGSAFFVAISFWHINFSRIGFRAIMAPALLVWGLYFLIRSFDAGTQKSNARWIVLSVIGGAIYGLGMHSYIAYRATPLLVLVLFILFKKHFNLSWKRSVAIGAVFVVASLIVFAPLGLYFLSHPQDFFGRTSQVSVFSSQHPLGDLFDNILKTIGMFFFRGDGNWRHNFSGAPEVFWPVALLFLWGIVGSIWRAIRSKQDRGISALFWMSVWWIGIGMLPVVISDEGIPHALRAILIIPPVFIVSGIGLWYAYQYISKFVGKKMLWVLGVLIMIILMAHTFTTYFISWANRPEVKDAFATRYVRIGEQLNHIGPSIEKYVVVNAGGVDVRGIPMPAQTIMFITDTFSSEDQEAKHIHYVLDDVLIPSLNRSVVFYLEPK